MEFALKIFRIINTNEVGAVVGASFVALGMVASAFTESPWGVFTLGAIGGVFCASVVARTFIDDMNEHVR